MGLRIFDLEGNQTVITGKQVFFAFENDEVDFGIAPENLKQIIKDHFANSEGRRFSVDLPAHRKQS